jgi:PST family polysaccharide transporter
MKRLKLYFQKISDKDNNRQLRNNFFSLSALQFANYILPLITLPYLVRVLGPEKYGLLAFATAFITYFQLFTDYGFNLSATRKISIYREDKRKLSKIFSSVMLSKSLLFFISLILLIIIIFSFPELKKNFLVYILTFGTVIGNLLFPVWFFQGMEKMKYITLLNITAKILFTIAIFAFIKNMGDYIYVPLINSFGYIIAGTLGLLIAKRNYDLKLTFTSWSDIKSQLNDGWHVFLSTGANSLLSTSNTFILGIFTNNIAVSYYAVAEKVVMAVVGLIYPLTQTIFPHITRLVFESKEKGIIFISKVTKLIIVFGLSTSILLFLFAGTIVNILFGNQYAPAIEIMRILAFLPLIMGLGQVLGVQTMLTFNLKKAYSQIILLMGICNVLLALLLVPIFHQIGTAVSFMIIQIIGTILMFLFLQKKGIKLFNLNFR